MSRPQTASYYSSDEPHHSLIDSSFLTLTKSPTSTSSTSDSPSNLYYLNEDQDTDDLLQQAMQLPASTTNSNSNSGSGNGSRIFFPVSYAAASGSSSSAYASSAPDARGLETPPIHSNATSNRRNSPLPRNASSFSSMSVLTQKQNQKFVHNSDETKSTSSHFPDRQEQNNVVSSLIEHLSLHGQMSSPCPAPLSSRRARKCVIGVCAMDKKARSKPMTQILDRLRAYGESQVVIFGDALLLDESIPVQEWPICDCLISFTSTGFPLQKVIEYVRLRKPFCFNDLPSQASLLDRRLVYEILEQNGIPTAKHLLVDRDTPEKAAQVNIEEHGDYILIQGERLNKPIVEKPVDSEDHNIYIYYAASQGGGSRRLFRKVGNRSSRFYPRINSLRRDGSYVYEELFVNGKDLKVYTIGPGYAHGEMRKSPVVDGIVERDPDKKELRLLTKLSENEKQIAAAICSAFKQNICGFDIIRSQGQSYVIDVNGWSFVKGNMRYYDKCARILRKMALSCRQGRQALRLTDTSAIPRSLLLSGSNNSISSMNNVVSSMSSNYQNEQQNASSNSNSIASSTQPPSNQLPSTVTSSGATLLSVNNSNIVGAPHLIDHSAHSRGLSDEIRLQPTPISVSGGAVSVSQNSSARLIHATSLPHLGSYPSIPYEQSSSSASSPAAPLAFKAGASNSPLGSLSPQSLLACITNPFVTDPLSPLSLEPESSTVPSSNIDVAENVIMDLDNNDVLRALVAVFRHADRTPKQKVKLKTKHPALLALFKVKQGSSPPTEIKYKRKEDLTELLPTVKAMIVKEKVRNKRKARLEREKTLTLAQSVNNSTAQLGSVSSQVPNSANVPPSLNPSHSYNNLDRARKSSQESEDDSGGELAEADGLSTLDVDDMDEIERTFWREMLEKERKEREKDPDYLLKLLQVQTVLERGFGGVKVQLKAKKTENNRVVQALLVCKWGGEMTHAGVGQARQYAAAFWDDMCPAPPPMPSAFFIQKAKHNNSSSTTSSEASSPISPLYPKMQRASSSASSTPTAVRQQATVSTLSAPPETSVFPIVSPKRAEEKRTIALDRASVNANVKRNEIHSMSDDRKSVMPVSSNAVATTGGSLPSPFRVDTRISAPQSSPVQEVHPLGLRASTAVNTSISDTVAASAVVNPTWSQRERDLEKAYLEKQAIFERQRIEFLSNMNVYTSDEARVQASAKAFYMSTMEHAHATQLMSVTSSERRASTKAFEKACDKALVSGREVLAYLDDTSMCAEQMNRAKEGVKFLLMAENAFTPAQVTRHMLAMEQIARATSQAERDRIEAQEEAEITNAREEAVWREMQEKRRVEVKLLEQEEQERQERLLDERAQLEEDPILQARMYDDNVKRDLSYNVDDVNVEAKADAYLFSHSALNARSKSHSVKSQKSLARTAPVHEHHHKINSTKLQKQPNHQLRTFVSELPASDRMREIESTSNADVTMMANIPSRANFPPVGLVLTTHSINVSDSKPGGVSPPPISPPPSPSSFDPNAMTAWGVRCLRWIGKPRDTLHHLYSLLKQLQAQIHSKCQFAEKHHNQSDINLSMRSHHSNAPSVLVNSLDNEDHASSHVRPRRNSVPGLRDGTSASAKTSDVFEYVFEDGDEAIVGTTGKHKIARASTRRFAADHLLCHHETLLLLKLRWDTLISAFYNPYTRSFDPTKVPDVYDALKYDVLHNSEFITECRPLYTAIKRVADFVVPQEYGVLRKDRWTIGVNIAQPLFRRIIGNLASGLEARPTNRVTLYFSSESHIHALRNVLLLCGIAENRTVATTLDAIELNYLSHAVFRLYEDLSQSIDDPRRFYVSVQFSPGAALDPFIFTEVDHSLPVSRPVPVHGRIPFSIFQTLFSQIDADELPSVRPYLNE